MNTLPAVTIIKEMFTVIEKIHVAHIMATPDSPDGYFDACRSHMYKELLRAQPLDRLSNKEIFEQFKTGDATRNFVFMFFGNVNDLWVTLFAKLTPQAANIEEIMQSNEIYIDSEGWVYNLRCPGIRMGVYQTRGM